jgi:hypothetical protein
MCDFSASSLAYLNSQILVVPHLSLQPDYPDYPDYHHTFTQKQSGLVLVYFSFGNRSISRYSIQIGTLHRIKSSLVR